MAIRYLKISLAFFLGIYCLLDGGQNSVNFEKGHEWLTYVVSMKEHTLFPNSVGPGVTSPVATYAMWTLNIVCQLIAGFLGLKGAFDMWSARKEGAARFNKAKTFGILSAGAAVLLWFGLYNGVLGGYFMMWQTEWGSATLAAAWPLAGMGALLLIFFNTPDQEVERT